jgi:hypothetical protein
MQSINKLRICNLFEGEVWNRILKYAMTFTVLTLVGSQAM